MAIDNHDPRTSPTDWSLLDVRTIFVLLGWIMLSSEPSPWPMWPSRFCRLGLRLGSPGVLTQLFIVDHDARAASLGTRKADDSLAA
jgi:hypothetical protein